MHNCLVQRRLQPVKELKWLILEHKKFNNQNSFTQLLLHSISLRRGLQKQPSAMSPVCALQIKITR